MGMPAYPRFETRSGRVLTARENWVEIAFDQGIAAAPSTYPWMPGQKVEVLFRHGHDAALAIRSPRLEDVRAAPAQRATILPFKCRRDSGC